MTSLLDFPSPPASAYGAKPLSPEEIDAHPDRDRLWATIVAVRDASEDREYRASEEGKNEGYEQGRADYECRCT